MKKLFTRIVCWSLAALCVILITGAAACYLKYRQVAGRDLPAVHASTSLIPADGKVRLGAALDARFEFVAPWGKTPTNVDASAGEGSQLVEQPRPRITKINWGTVTWGVDCRLQPFSIGDIPEGKLKLAFADAAGRETPIELPIPKLRSEPLPEADRADLAIAGKLPPERAPRWIYVTAGVTALALIGLLSFMLVRRKASEPAPRIPPWVVALTDLKSLRKEFSGGGMCPLECVSSLTDIVRNYLEDRFSIHAPRQTTNEFLRNLESSDSPLKNTDRNFLSEFMTAADMVKFARWDAPRETIDETIDRASDLVTGTIPEAGGKSAAGGDSKTSKQGGKTS